jgi:hypothetical protein
MIVSFSYIKYGSDEIVYLGNTRDISRGTNVNTFLTYGGSLGLNKYIEMFDRQIRSNDINLYVGFLLLPFFMISLLYVRKKISFAVGLIALVVFLFSIGTFVSLFFYYLWPLGKIFRHIGLTATVFKLFMVFYAGFGFEVFIEQFYPNKRLAPFILIYLLVILIWFVFKPIIFTAKYFYFISALESKILLWLVYLALEGSYDCYQNAEGIRISDSPF